MKQKILYILLMITTALSWSLEAEAQTTCYVLSNTGDSEVTVMDRWSSNKNVTYKLSGPGKTLSVDHYKIWSATNDITIYGYESENGSGTSIELRKLSSNTNWQTTTIDISSYPKIRSIKFSGGGTERKYIRNVSVTRATTLTSSTSAIDFGKNNFGTDVTRTISVDYNNTYNPTDLTGICTNSAFKVDAKSMGESGTTDITIHYNPTAMGEHNGTVTFTMGSASYQFAVQGYSKLDYTYTAAAHTNDPSSGTANVVMDEEAGTNGSTIVIGKESTSSSDSKEAIFTAVAADGYEFDGWYSDAECTQRVSINEEYRATLTASPSNLAPSAILYAKFELQSSKSDNTIVWKENPVVTTDALTPIDLSGYASSTAGLAVTYDTSDHSIATIEGTLLTPHAAGPINIIATAAETEDYDEAVDELAFTVTAVPTHIEWDQEFPALTDRYERAITLTASLVDIRGNAVDGISYAVTEGNAVEIRDGKVYVVLQGTAAITASYSGDAVYAAAESVQKSITVGGYSYPTDWVNDWTASPVAGEQFYLYNTTNSKFLQEGHGEESNNAFVEAANASLWTYSSSKKIESVSNSSNFIANRTNQASTNGDGNVTGYSFKINNNKWQITGSYIGQNYDVFNNGGVFDGYHNGSHYEWYLISPAQYDFRTQIAPAAVENYLYNSDYAAVVGSLRDQLAAAVQATSDFAGANSRIAALEQAFDDYIAAIVTINTFESEYAANTPDAVNPVNDIAAARTALASATSSAEIATAVAHLRAFDVITISKQPAALVSLPGGAVSAGIVATANGTIAYVSDDAEVLTITTDGITITPVAEGSTTITLSTETSATHYAAMPVQTIAVSVSDALVLSNATVASYTPGEYGTVVIERTLKEGYNSIAIPFDVALSALNADWAAQLSIVAYNTNDGYSLYFQKFTEGTLNANEPYIIHVTAQKENPQFSNVTVEAAVETTKQATGGVNAGGHSYLAWSMTSNYTPDFDMQGKYGVVNSKGVLKLGGAGSTLSAFGAYITGPAAAGGSNQKVATRFVDDDELAGIIEQIEAGAFEDTTIIYDLSGRACPEHLSKSRTSHTASGVKIEVSTNGKSRKVLR